MIKLKERVDQCRSSVVRHRIATNWLEPVRAGERRLAGRVEAKLGAQYRPRWRRRYPVRIADLSTHGCRLIDAGHLVVGTYAWIVLPGLETWYARVAWCDGAACGLDFADPLHEAAAAMLTERAMLCQVG